MGVNKNSSLRIKKTSSNLILVGTVGALLLIVVFSVLLGNKKSNLYTLELNGDAYVVVYKGGAYEDPGAKVYDEENNDLSQNIIVDSNLNLKKTGQYEIVYKFNDVYVKRIIKVIEKQPLINNENSDNDEDDEDENLPKKGETIIALNGDETVYIDVNGNYKEEGFTAIDTVDGNIKKKVKVTHNVDNRNPGSYQVVYTVKNSSGITTSVARNIIVMKVDLGLSLVNNYYTSEDVTIKVNVEDEYFDYLVLPNGMNTTDKNCSYTVSQNGTYNFKLVNKHGIVKEKSIIVGNIDRTNPSGSCSGYFKDDASYINVVGNDDMGIGYYIIDGKSYSSNSIKLNKEVNSVSVDIFDMANNKTTVSCNLADKNDFISSDKSITFSYQFVSDKTLAYGLYTPSTAAKNKKTPLIIWLHGAGSVGAEYSKFSSNFLSFMKKWELEGFNAYIVCPLLRHGSWNTQTAKTNVYNLVNNIIKDKNIDTDKIILAGHSMGAQGIYNIADGKTDFYSALVFLSPYKATPSTIDISQFNKVPLVGYVGTVEAGEDDLSYNHATGTFSNTFGSEKLTIINTWHGNVPKYAFNIDNNKDNKSDLIEWMLKQ